MKKILIIAYFYPPKGGAGVQRTSKFAKYLTEFGHEVHVLTVNEDRKTLNDDSLKEDICKGIHVHRTEFEEVKIVKKLNNLLNNKNSLSPVNTSNNQLKKSNIKSKIKSICKKLFFKLYNFVYLPDDKKSWIDTAVKEAVKIIENEKIDVIYTTSAPYSAHLIGYKLSKQKQIKWIADFRDQWANNPFAEYGRMVEWRQKRLEKKVIHNAHKVISVSKPIIEDFKLRYYDTNKEKFEIITNGYDEPDFWDIEPVEKNSIFKIIYNGTLYGRMSPENILLAISNLIEKKKIDRDKIRIEFCGNIGNAHKGKVDFFKDKYPQLISIKNYLPHKESLKNLMTGSAVLLIIDGGKGSRGIYTGKIFEYIRSGKPIIAIVPDGVARDLIIKTKTGYCAYPNDIDEIEKNIYNLYTKFYKGEKLADSNLNEIKKYSRKNLSKQLSNIIEKL
ncbi:glycosyltransferase family 4 protein [Oceanirhabdus sp. W0125-5]|uniref:glycosyltransferase family 4 protein n=1 Tax=Oceanirhabdus sp. W0125-5 TaxID=2999116 RepID=UPI0022F2F835|nr:glycosyltransferase family 4 protein [Oceanirhabdus sp. W0125-5]WBW99446.1 glycosyltransferase family 4 protein [Oceanirhabdus sp. W0125-5]